MLAYLQLAGSMILVGSNVAIAKAILTELPAALLACLRFALVGLLLLPAPLRLTRAHWRLTPGQWLALIGLGLFGVVFYNLGMLYGLRWTGATDAAIVTSTIPAVVALLSIPLLGEKLGRRGALAVLLSVAGMLVITLPAGQASAGSWIGNLMVFGAVVSEALYVIASRKLGSAFPPYAMIWIVNLMGLIGLAPLAALEWNSVAFADVPAWVWGLLVLYSLSAGLFAFVLWFAGIRHVPANRAGLFTGMLPVSAALVAVIGLGESFTLAHGVGMALVLTAIGLGARQGETA